MSLKLTTLGRAYAERKYLFLARYGANMGWDILGFQPFAEINIHV